MPNTKTLIKKILGVINIEYLIIITIKTWFWL